MQRGSALRTRAPSRKEGAIGYSAGRQTTIDVTDLIWKHARMSGFALAAQSHAVKVAAWATLLPLLTAGTVTPIVASTYKLEDAAEALRHLIEDRPCGRVVLAGQGDRRHERAPAAVAPPVAPVTVT